MKKFNQMRRDDYNDIISENLKARTEKIRQAIGFYPIVKSSAKHTETSSSLRQILSNFQVTLTTNVFSH